MENNTVNINIVEISGTSYIPTKEICGNCEFENDVFPDGVELMTCPDCGCALFQYAAMSDEEYEEYKLANDM